MKVTREQCLQELKEKADIGYKKNPKNRSYKERRDIWEYERFLHPNSNDWSEGEMFDIYIGDKLARNEIKEPYDGSDFPEWFREMGKSFGKQMKILDDIYTLVGMSVSYFDYYYIVRKDDGDKKYVSCVIAYEILD